MTSIDPSSRPDSAGSSKTFASEPPTAPDAGDLGERDARFLRQAIDWADKAKQGGNRPFGAVIVGADGEVIAEAGNTTHESDDRTAHAETNAIRALAGSGLTREQLASATLYASGEPCVMCAGAIFSASIRRVVFGLDVQRLRVFRAGLPHQNDLQMSCRDVFATSPEAIECIGPALLDEAGAVHVGGWDA
ncbi:MAG: nucleoside deaminase [Variovorax sp.]